MRLVSEILGYRSVSIAGLAKNAGKTECLNRILREIPHNATIAVTSIGVDGESVDSVQGTAKPEITLREGMIFTTSETHYRSRELVSEILHVSDERTALGRLVTARVVAEGKVLLSGPSDTAALRRAIDADIALGAQTVLVDGAISRLSPASPAVTDAMILATGAAVSGNIPQLVRATKYVCDLIALPEADLSVKSALAGIEQGVWTLHGGELREAGISALSADASTDHSLKTGSVIYVAGALSNSFLQSLSRGKGVADTVVVVRDFTRIFAKPETYRTFTRRGGRIEVMKSTRLLAVSINPYSPAGFTLDSRALQEAMEAAVDVDVFDAREMP